MSTIDPYSLVKKLKKPIALIGMMGAGKSHMARALSKSMDWPFFDSDHVIEEKAGLAVSEIFEQFGEPKFRDVEKRTILELLEQKEAIIATGGGAVMNSETLDALCNRAIVVWLDADIDSLMERVSKNTNRPLLQTENPQAILEELLNKRRPLYACAHIHFDSSREKEQKPDEVVVQDMLQAIDNYWEKNS